jgi:hypothetical protein
LGYDRRHVRGSGGAGGFVVSVIQTECVSGMRKRRRLHSGFAFYYTFQLLEMIDIQLPGCRALVSMKDELANVRAPVT